MDGLRPMTHGRQQIGFLLFSFLFVALAVVGGYFASFSTAKAASAELLEEKLTQFGVAARYLKTAFPEDSDKYIAELAMLSVEKTTAEDFATGEAALGKYGYRTGMNLRLIDSYDEIQSQANAVIRQVLFFSCAALMLLGLFFIESLQRNVKRLHSYAESVLETLRTNERNPFSGNCGTLYMSITTLGTRFSSLLSILDDEKKYLKDFISDISHQMKTPLAILMMNNELMLDDEMPMDSRRDFITKSDSQLSRLKWLVAGLLRLARIDANVVNFHIENLPVAKTAGIAAEYHLPAADDKNIAIVNSIPEGILVPHDREWTAEAIGNIIKNAIEHTPSGGRIELTAEENPLTVCLYITDNGSGIAPDVLPHIFERFYTGSDGTDVTNIGIGLSLTKSILDKHGALIHASSPPEGGTVMRLTFFKDDCE